MQPTDKSENNRLMSALAILWTLIIASALIWNTTDIKKEIYQESKQMARVALHKDIMYRTWSSMHGGVYVPVTDKTPPNPHLSHIPERDIVTPSGRQLTLMNPAYMTRQVYEISKDRYDIYARITSIKPLRPQNAPDEWEFKALESFEKGEKEISEIQNMNRKEFMRLMIPFYIEESCMKCHSHQGYKLGDIRGGISVAVPLEHLKAIRRQNEWVLIFRYLCLWIFGIGGIWLTWAGIRRHTRQRRHAEEALRENRELLNAILNSSGVGIGLAKNRSLVWCNQTLCQMIGYEMAEAIGRSTREIYQDTGEFERIGCELYPRLRKSGTSELELRFVRKDGSVFDAHVTTSLLKSSDLSEGVIFAVSDITGRKQMETELRQAKEAAESATRAKSEFLAKMSHEIRTPLNAVIGFSRIVFNKEVGELNRVQTEYLENVIKSSEHLLALITDILDFSKIEAGKLELEILDFNLNDIVGEVVNLMRFKAEEKSIRLTSLIDPDVPSCLRGDPTRLRQILLNLMNNAVKFTEKGSVNVTVRSREAEALSPHFSFLTFEISDTGIGIPKEDRDRLFQAFSQTDASVTRRFGGTGLGLAIAKALVEKMNGQIGVESAEGKGSKFRFTAEFEKSVKCDVSSVKEENTPDTFHITHKTPIRILLVEDNELNRKLVLHILKKLGFQADSANDGREAIRAMQTIAYDIVLMDIQMPEMDGIEATKFIRSTHNTPIIALTAHAMKSDRDRCIEAGMNDYITKPVNPDELLRAIQNQLSRFPKQRENSQTEENMTERKVFDRYELLKLAGHDEALCRDMLGAFVRYFPGMIGELKSALDQNDAYAVRMNAHSLKGSCRQMAAHRLSDVFAEMEILAQSGELDKVRSMMDKAEEEYEKLNAELQKF